MSSKSQLIERLTQWQVVVLFGAIIGFGWWVHQCVHSIVRTQIMEENRLIASQMAKLIHHAAPTSIRGDSWDAVQKMIEDVHLPNDGYMCVIGATDGKVICHPELRNNPNLRDMNIGDMTIQVDADAVSIRAAVAKAMENNADAPATGLLLAGQNTQVISAAHLPESDSILLVHQKESGPARAISQLLWPIGIIGLFIGSGTILVTRRLSASLLDQYENRLAVINSGLEATVQQRTQSLTRTRDSVIFGLAKLSESRDNDTGEHLDRIRTYVTLLARELSAYHAFLDEEYIKDIGLASSLHDIGKVGVPDSVLLKPQRLNAEERRMIEVHPKVGKQCLQAIGERLGEDNFLNMATQICAYHHEKWDGTGYPEGLAGEDIPLSARIVALADVYDALTSRRPYKEPMSHEKARQIILEGNGKHFDPQVVDAFLACESQFQSFASSASAIDPALETTASTGISN